MKMKLTPIVLVLAACTQGTMQSTSQPKNEDWMVEVLESSKDGESVTIKLTNTTDASLSILDPFNKVVQRKNGEKWDKINLIYCLCEVSCPPPPEEKKIGPGSVYTFSWDKKGKSCNGNKTVRTAVGSGNFQVVITYTKERASQKLIVPFEY